MDRTNTTRRRKLLMPAGLVAAAGLAMGLGAVAQAQYDDDQYAEHYEWEPGTGVHEEEWYDPTDWWDDDYGERYIDYEETGYDNYDYDNGYDDDRYGEHYENEPGYGVHEEEWYDPTDWWDDDYGERYIDREEMGNDDWDDDNAYYDNYYNDNENNVLNDNYNEYYPNGYEPGYYDRYYTGDSSANNARNRSNQNRANQNRANQNRADRSRNNQFRDNQYYDDNAYTRSYNDRNRQRQGQRDMNRSSNNAQLRGEIDGYSRVNLNGQKDQHTLVRIRLDSGRSAIVNLGPNVELSRLNLSDGDRIAVQGQRGSINGNDVLMAKRVRVGDQTVRMNNWDRVNQNNRAQAQRDQMRRDANRGMNQDRYQRSQYAQQNRRGNTQDRVHPDAREIQRIISEWPSQSRKAAQEMLSKYGKPAGITPMMLIWTDTGPFTKTVVYSDPVDHKFPVQHKDVLEQCVEMEVPADKADELAKFDGSLVIYHTDGTVSARCHKQALNILALNLADKIVNDDMTVQEARQKFKKDAQAYMDGDKPEMTQQLTFNNRNRSEQYSSAAGQND
jgi:hypothetical protein